MRNNDHRRLHTENDSPLTPAEFGFLLDYRAEENNYDQAQREQLALSGLVAYTNARIEAHWWCPTVCAAFERERQKYKEGGLLDFKPLVLEVLNGERWFTTLDASHDLFFDVPTNWATAQAPKTSGYTEWLFLEAAGRGGDAGSDDAGDILAVQLSSEHSQFETGSDFRRDLEIHISDVKSLAVDNPSLRDFESKVRRNE